jgi:hypothetical protein
MSCILIAKYLTNKYQYHVFSPVNIDFSKIISLTYCVCDICAYIFAATNPNNLNLTKNELQGIFNLDQRL